MMVPGQSIIITCLAVFANFLALGSTCGYNEVLCKNTNKCVHIGYICDGDYDCSDMTDESFCEEWKNTGCTARGMALCPRDGEDACIPIMEYCSASPPCGGVVDPRICVMMNNRVIQQISSVVLQEPTTTPVTEPSTTTEPTTTPTPEWNPEPNNLDRSELQGEIFGETLNTSFQHSQCPKFYTRVGDECLSFFYILKLGWGEAKHLCEFTGGQLLSFDDDNEKFISILKYMRENGITSDFWIGGRYVNDGVGWSWLSEMPMETGTPFWGVRYEDSCTKRTGEYKLGPHYLSNKTACYHYQQAPKPNTADHCVALTYKYYHYMTDEDCLSERSPLCVANDNEWPIEV